jgi:hypothetical protein
MNIIGTEVLYDQYSGLTKIDLRPYWNESYKNTPVLNSDSFREYAEMRKVLSKTDAYHKFEWINSGLYLPDYVWLSNDTATFFKLKYGI